MTDYRILVTGSRDLTDHKAVQRHIALAAAQAPPGTRVIIVHGNAPGADTFADRAALSLGLHPEAHDAPWHLLGQAAGPARNQEMVDAGADLCLAFFKRGGRNIGTADCAARAIAAGIHLKTYTLA
jgi:hypothetical protein